MDKILFCDECNQGTDKLIEGGFPPFTKMRCQKCDAEWRADVEVTALGDSERRFLDGHGESFEEDLK